MQLARIDVGEFEIVAPIAGALCLAAIVLALMDMAQARRVLAVPVSA